MEQSKPIVRYLCDGEIKDCRKRICYKTIGDCKTACKYTQDIRHAKNFQKKHPEIEQAGFWEKETTPDEQAQQKD